jgi:hypothetical protein
MVEVQVLQEQKTCHAADGLSKVLPVHVSRYYLWVNSGHIFGFIIFKNHNLQW